MPTLKSSSKTECLVADCRLPYPPPIVGNTTSPLKALGKKARTVAGSGFFAERIILLPAPEGEHTYGHFFELQRAVGIELTAILEDEGQSLPMSGVQSSGIG